MAIRQDPGWPSAGQMAALTAAYRRLSQERIDHALAGAAAEISNLFPFDALDGWAAAGAYVQAFRQIGGPDLWPELERAVQRLGAELAHHDCSPDDVTSAVRIPVDAIGALLDQNPAYSSAKVPLDSIGRACWIIGNTRYINEREEELRALRRVTLPLPALALAKGLETLVERGISALGADAGAILVLDEDGLLEVRASLGRICTETKKLPGNTGFAGRVLQAARPIKAERGEALPFLASDRIGATVGAPVQIDGQPVGVVLIAWSRQLAPSPGDLHITQVIATRTGSALAVRGVLNRARTEVAWLAAFRDTVAVANTSFDDAERCQAMIRQIMPLLPNIVFADVVRLDDSRDRLDVIAHLGYPDGFFERWGHLASRDQHVWSPAVLAGRPWYVENVETADLPAPARLYCQQAGIGAYAVLPLRGRDQTLGALHLASAGPRRFATQERAALAVAAGQLGALIENSLLYSRERDRAAELERLNRSLVELDHLKTEFLAMVSHELRTPLTTILGYAELATLPGSEVFADRLRLFMTSIRQSGDQLLSLINDLLEFSSLDAGITRPQLGPADIGEVVGTVLERRREAAAARGIVLRTRGGCVFPLVQGDKRQLTRVLDLLVENALKFTDAGGTVEIVAEVPDPGTWVLVRVRDNGQGIEADQLGRIWDLFYQADSSATRRHGGLGLGLAIARRLVEGQGGRIWAESAGAAGEGTTITFSMPVSADQDSNPFVGPTILIAENCSGNSTSIRQAVEESFRCRTVLAGDGEQAVDLAHDLKPALILMDMMMPVLSGYEATERLKADPRTCSIPVIAVGAKSQPADVERAMACGCADFIECPSSPGDFAAKLRAHLPAN